ncbi:MAG: RNA polymerase sigma factor [Bacteroidales bacterium]|jgi:RNA polymerase sigma-70 factor (ECF subfamily)|nr:RNA polymerase sigma factor [Bacteroidales bacterium]
MKRDKEKFLELLSGYQGIIHKVSLVYFRNPSDREDNVQEIIYQLWKSFPNLKDHQRIGSWIYAVAINTSISGIKKQSRMEYRESVGELIAGADLMDEITLNESSRLLLDAIHDLSEPDRTVMMLWFDELSYDEIAEIIGISKSNVGVRINRAKEKLKNKLNN